jgi:hypothetical protein
VFGQIWTEKVEAGETFVNRDCQIGSCGAELG